LPERRPPSASAAVAAIETAWLAARQRAWRQKETPRRLAFAFAAAIAVALIAALASRLPIARTIEDKTEDARFGLARARPPDPRIIVVAIDEASLAEDSRPVADWSNETAALLERLFAAGARAVAIDILPPESWARSNAFGRAVMHHGDRLALALQSKDGQVIGSECVAPLTAYQLGPERYANLFGFVNLEEDPDHVVRRARAVYPVRQGRRCASLAARAIAAASLSAPLPGGAPFRIDYSVHPRDIPRVSWKDVKNTDTAFFRDRIVFIGATFGNDELPIPASVSAVKIPGVVLEAQIANTIASGFPIRDPGLPACLMAMGAAACLAIALALRYPHRSWIALVVVGAAACGYLAMALVLWRSLNWMIAVTAPEIAIFLAAGAAWTLKSRLSPYPEDKI
jgi:CHASE2 domain-containing sensor protein